MADTPPQPNDKKKSRYAADRGAAGAFEGETMTRRGLMTGGALAAGGIATAAFGLPALGFAVGPLLEDQEPQVWQDVGPESDFTTDTYVPRVINIVAEIGDPGKTTIYVRKALPEDKSPSDKPGVEPLPMVVISTRCSHLGCPVRYIQASKKFVCPCHGGIYDDQGAVGGGPPVRPLDRFYNRLRSGRVEIGDRFSLNNKLDRFQPRDPSQHLDGLWQYLYPSRPTA